MIESEPIGKQQAKSQRARRSLCEATVACLVRDGYAETSLNRVAALANLSKGALQHHFSTKEDLMVATANFLLQRPFETPEHAGEVPHSVADYIKLTWHKLVNTEGYRALLEILVAARTDRMLQTRLSDTLLTWNDALNEQARGKFTSKLGYEQDVEILMTMTRSLMRGLVIQDQYSEDPALAIQYIDRWIELISPLLELKSTAERL
ncbi:TetR/AcrR family transcriptional regulator [Sneathiella marina]|uniref:TetR/AcrR family transcriptional regulator n=1 Tax=Sneathiella marina TaxID=2950108 RepID=A0ABY4W7X0_9PROT|nr:TetR/AcrR family transcriptional regulator [Sneathiella marina]USG60746.1 TetR/AcrR family transcriptional regulator [Sneathiella marina]